MNPERAWTGIEFGAAAALIVGIVGCAIGIAVSGAAVYRAWLCAYLFCLGLPLGAVSLILVHDLTGGAWMGSARPALAAAAVTMPLATLAGVPVLIGIGAIYPGRASAISAMAGISTPAFSFSVMRSISLSGTLLPPMRFGRRAASPSASRRGCVGPAPLASCSLPIPPASPRSTGSCRSTRISGRRFFR